MKGIFNLIGISALTILASCGGNNKYEITATFQDTTMNGEMFYLENNDSKTIIDSAVVENGVLKFEGVAETVLPVEIKSEKMTTGSFILEPGNMTFDVENQVMRGTVLNDVWADFRVFGDKTIKEYRAQQKSIIASEAPEKVDSLLNALVEKVQAKLDVVEDSVFAANANNMVGYYVIAESYFDKKADLDSMLVNASEWTENSQAVQKKLVHFEKLEKTAVGKMFTDFTVTMSDGKEFKLSDVVGKGNYVLVDFWASWCGPCMREMATLKEINKEFAPKGLKVVGIAVWDKPEDTKKAVEAKELPWMIVDNAQKIPTDIYGIQGIPHIILFGPDGTIVSRGLQGKELQAAVKAELSK